eukprot:PhM_4_TR14526/c0_g1_i1/m.54039
MEQILPNNYQHTTISASSLRKTGPGGGILSTNTRTDMTRIGRRDQPQTWTLEEWEDQVQDTLSDRFAASTTRRREYLARMIDAFLVAHNVALTPRTARMAMEWIGTGTSRRTLYGYATTARAMYPQLCHPLFEDF